MSIMWSYYGSKRKIANKYPAPKHKIVIEPFAGAAWYSVLHRSKDVWLNEKYDVIYGIWDWLINKATPLEILNNADFVCGQDVRGLSVEQHHKNLIGFCINRGSSSPCNIVQGWSCQSKSRPDWASTASFQLRRIANLVKEIKHWRVDFGHYEKIPNIEATWFIDPPYQYGGNRYCESDIDYKKLSEWCLSRKGQVIVCENSKADWLDFVAVGETVGQRHKTVECVWVKE